MSEAGVGDMQFHEAANIFPMMLGEDYAALVEDIRAHGLRESIKLFEGKILDGRNRYRACAEAGIEPRFEQFCGDDPLAYTLSMNLQRRHLNESQRAMIAAKVATMLHGGDRRSEQAASLHLVSRASAASMLNVSPRSVASAAQVIDHGAPELVAAVEKGEIAVSTAAEKCRPERSPRPSARETMERAIEQAAKFFSDTDLSEMTESERASHEHSADIFTIAVATQRYADTRFVDLFFLAAMKILSDVPDLAGMVERLIKAGKLDAQVVTKIGRALTAAGSPIIQGESHAMATVARTGAAARKGASG